MKTINNIKIKIEFDYISGNGNIIKLIKNLADKNEINGILKKENEKITIFLDDEIAKIEKFSDEIGKTLPLSIFMGNANTVAVENLPEKIEDGFKVISDINILPQNLSPCPNCLKELFNPDDRRFFYPFISCNYCGSHYSYLYEYPFKREKTIFKFFQPCSECSKEHSDKNSLRYKYELISCYKCLTPVYLKKGENERYGFDKEKMTGAVNSAVGVIKKGNLLRIYTSQGEKVLGLPTEENIRKVREHLNLGRKPLTLLLTNAKSLENIAFFSDTELKTLASQEKPVVQFQAKNFKEKEFFTDKLDFINVKLPDEPLLILLSSYLKNEGINYLFTASLEEDFHKNITEFELNADLPVVNKQKDVEIVTVQGKFLIKSGEKGIFPNIINSKPTGNLSIGKDYAVLDLGNGEYLIDKKEKILFQLPDFVEKINNVNILNGEFEDIKLPFKNKKSFSSYEGAILSVLAEYNKLEEPAVGVYFSYKENDDLIALKSHLKNLKPLIKIKPVRLFMDFNQTVKWSLEEIKKSSEEGEKLVNNFYKKFPEFEKIQYLELDGKFKEISSITGVLNIISKLLQIFPYENYSYFEEPYRFLEKESLDFVGKQALMVDYFLEEDNGNFYLNWLKLIQSVLSYKIAGVDNKMIAFSIFEGLGDWIIKETEKISKKMKVNNIVLTGAFFDNPVLTGRIIKHFRGKYNILLNRKLPIDNQNIAFGGIFV